MLTAQNQSSFCICVIHLHGLSIHRCKPKSSPLYVSSWGMISRGVADNGHQGLDEEPRDYLHISRLCSTTSRHILSHRRSDDQIEWQLESGNGECRGERGSSAAHVRAHEFHSLMRNNSVLVRNGKREGKEWTYSARFEADPSGVERNSLANEGKWARVGLVGAFVMPVEGGSVLRHEEGTQNE